jgi:hypothetical protein
MDIIAALEAEIESSLNSTDVARLDAELADVRAQNIEHVALIEQQNRQLAAAWSEIARLKAENARLKGHTN